MGASASPLPTAEDELIHQMKTQCFTGNPPYSLLP